MDRRRSLGVALALWGAWAGACAAATERFTISAGGERVGQLVADVGERTITTDYAVSNNGRGPKAKETIELDDQGRVVKWTIKGSSLFGAPVDERFTWTAGSAEWVSQADKGEVRAKAPPLYVANDGSPFINALYVKALLKAPNHTLTVLPSGSMKLTEVRKLTVGEGAKALQLTAYELAGIDMNPEYILVDAEGRMFGTLGGGLIREGYEAEARGLGRIAAEISMQRARDAQKQLAHRFAGPVRIRNVRIFDPKAMALGGLSSVLIEDGKIKAVGPDQKGARGETVIDGRGGTLMPGLHDMHSHTTLSSNLFNLAAGVTATRDQGNGPERLMNWMKLLDAGEIAGPRIVRNGFIEGRSPYSSRTAFIAGSLDEALKDVDFYGKAGGYFQIKIYNSINPDWVAPMVERAKTYGMGATGHVPAFSTPDRVLREGFQDIAHINQLMLGWILEPGEDTRTTLRLTGLARAKDLDLKSSPVRVTLDLMKAKHAALDSTVMTVERLMLSRSGEVQEGDQPYLDHAPIGYQRYRRRSFVTISSPADDKAYQDSFAKILETVKLLDDEGIQLLPGTDDTTGFSVHRELELYAKAGIPLGKVLKLGTLDCETYLKRGAEAGSIEPGKLAELILVAGDPTKTIRDIRQVRMTMVRGVAYYPAEIYGFLGVKPFAAPPPVSVPK